jgi:Flp pilus assembly protein TadD
MRQTELRLMLVVACCTVALSGCATLNFTGGKTAANTKSTATNADSGSLPPMGLSADDSAPTAVPTSAKSPQETLEGQFAMGRLAERHGRSDEAEATYRALLEKSPNDARLHHRLAVIAVRKSDFEKAEEHFRAATAIGTPSKELLSDMGYCYYLQQRLPEAEKSLNEALKLDASYDAAINNLALVRGAQGRFKESLDLFKRTNSEAEAYANVGYVLAQHGQTAQAREMYLRALSLNNNMRAAAQAMVQLDEREKAVAGASASRPNRAAKPAERFAPEDVIEIGTDAHDASSPSVTAIDANENRPS